MRVVLIREEVSLLHFYSLCLQTTVNNCWRFWKLCKFITKFNNCFWLWRSFIHTFCLQINTDGVSTVCHLSNFTLETRQLVPTDTKCSTGWYLVLCSGCDLDSIWCYACVTWLMHSEQNLKIWQRLNMKYVSSSYLCRLPAHKASGSILLAFSLFGGRGGKHVFGERKQSLMLSDHHCHQLLDLRSRCEEKQTQMSKD